MPAHALGGVCRLDAATVKRLVDIAARVGLENVSSALFGERGQDP